MVDLTIATSISADLDEHPLDAGFCRQSGEVVHRLSQWKVQSENYFCQLGVLDKGVFLVRAQGRSDVHTVKQFFTALELSRKDMGLVNRPWVLISDWSRLESTTSEGRRLYIESITEIPNLRGVIYYGVSGLFKATIKMGRALNRIPYPVRICNTYAQAAEIASALLRAPGQGVIPGDVDTVPTSIRGVQDLLEIMATIQWEMPGAPALEVFAEESPWKPVAEALYVIKRDLDAILKASQQRREQLSERNARTNELSRHLRSTLEESEHFKHILETESRRNQKLQQEMVDNQKELLFALGEIIETRSRETANHIRRVSEYTNLLALRMGFSEREATWLLHAAPMHDAGKIAIPDTILNKPGKLTPEEFSLMQTHAAEGYELLKGSNREILKAAAVIAYTHHEKWNGKGYPRGLQGEDIHIYGRMVALVDVFDALSSDRCYKKAWPLDKVLAYITEERGQSFDPAVVDVFLVNLPEFLLVREKWPDV